MTIKKKSKNKFTKKITNSSFLDNNIKNNIYKNYKNLVECKVFLTKRKSFKTFLLTTFIWIVISSLVFIAFSNISSKTSFLKDNLENKNNDFYSLTPIKIQIITSLKNSKYKNYIESIYLNPKEKNKLNILIKPNYWDILTNEEKQELTKLITKKWTYIYKKNNTDTQLKPFAQISNFK